jgi:hypothetical protein
MIIVKEKVDEGKAPIIEIFDTAQEFKAWIKQELQWREDELNADEVGLKNGQICYPYRVVQAPFKLAWETLRDMADYYMEIV